METDSIPTRPQDVSLQYNQPVLPVPPGGRVPDLNLAGADQMNVASGNSILPPMPDPEQPMPYSPVLNGDPNMIGMLGIDPQTPIPSLDLAGAQGTPPPDIIANPPITTSLYTPQDYGMPNGANPALTGGPGDLTAPAIDYRPAFQVDPLLPDLTDYRTPIGLDIRTTGTIIVPDPPISDLTRYDTPSGVDINNHPLIPDPLLPDLQDPTLTQQVAMQPEDRPGELDDDALNVMRKDPTHDAVEDTPYIQSFMDQTGQNTTRRRHFDIMMKGLSGEL